MEPTGAAPLRPTDLREIGPYRLLGRLGEGGMGTVFLARAPTGRFVALKVVKAEFANQEGFAARFHVEVDSARRVASFCTAQVLDNGNTRDGRPYMVTEYIAGTPLSEQIIRYGALEPGPLHGVALGVAAALAAIHVAELVHRDLKPANVILSLSGPRVIDFGIARALDRETGFTLSGELLGSPGWWAPEQVRGEQVSPAADIFAWGCLVAYAGNGRHPFGRGDPVTMATRVLNTPPDLGVLPAPLNDLVRRATSMDPALRPSAQELLIALVGGSVPAKAAADPPTLVATEMLNDWQPPQNVVNEPDITATFTTPPPSDATGRGTTGAATSQPGTASQSGPVPPGPPVQPSPAQGTLGSAGGSGGSPAAASASVEELARREEAAAKEELARWQVPGQERQERKPGLRGLFRAGKPPRSAGPPQDSEHSGEPPQSSERPAAPPQDSERSAAAPPQNSGRSAAPPRDSGRSAAPSRDSGRSEAPSRDSGRSEAPSRDERRPAQVGKAAVLGTETQPGARTSLTAPDDEPDTLGGTRTAGTRWLIAAAAAVLAIVVTVAVLIVTSERDTTVTANTGTPSASAGNSARPNDVGRRFPLGENFDDPVAIVSGTPVCGLKEYEGRTAAKGQLCVVTWTMINPGGERKELIQPVVTMVDDRGGEHDAAEITLPPAILPGARVDSAFVFDLAMYRRPVKMTANLLENGRQIEVGL